MRHKLCRLYTRLSSKASRYAHLLTHKRNNDQIIRQFAAKSSTILSLSDIITYTGSTPQKRKEYGKFVWNEIPIRISHRVIELSSLPYNLSSTAAIKELRDLYTHSFHLFRMLEMPDNDETENKFMNVMKSHFNSLKSAVPLISTGLTQCILENPNQTTLIQACPFLNGFLDRFNSARIGTRLLTGQYIACKEQERKEKTKTEGRILGLIDFECDPKKILENAVDDATRLAEINYGKSPDVNIKYSQDKNIHFAYIPSDLHYIFFELMKNAIRAVCEYNDDKVELPSIECVIVASQQSDDVTIKISDQGGGISRENMEKIWYYSFTTIMPESRPSMDPMDREQSAPIAGFGYGLPLSRLYARYFGGDLEVISMDGYGSDVFVYLNWLRPDDTRKLRAPELVEL